MEKLIYPVWKTGSQDGEQFRRILLEELAPVLLEDENLRGLRMAFVDDAVAEAAGKRMQQLHTTLPDGLLSVWVNDGGARGTIDAVLGKHVQAYSSYLVVEAEPIVNDLYPAADGQRVTGMCEVVFLQRPQRLTEAQWLEIWQGSHTQVAIDTQSTFGYRQNVVVRPLTEGAVAFDAMVEENFPADAMRSDHAFYGVEEGDDAGLQARQTAMFDSCARFIDFDRIDVIPMSEHLLKSF